VVSATDPHGRILGFLDPVDFLMLIIIPSLLRSHLSLAPVMNANHDNAAHYHILRL
jgi:hypothetical protein